uniref:Uncharacterized protein n=1 Tax=Acrobeloides nanus TaxID=290746 RepID=A0A914BXE0_9BILA
MSSNTRRKKKNFLFGGFSSGNQTTLTDSQFGFTQNSNTTSKAQSRETTPFIQSSSISRENIPGPSLNENDLELRISPSPPPAEPVSKKAKRESIVPDTPTSQLGPQIGQKTRQGRVTSSYTRRSTQVVPDSLASVQSTQAVAETQLLEVVPQSPEKEMVYTTSSGNQNGSNRIRMKEEDDFSPSPTKNTSSIGLFDPTFEIDHDKRDYTDKTELDDLKRQDIVEFKDLRRKDKRPATIVEDAFDFIKPTQEDGSKKFKKAKQGCFYYGNDNINKSYNSSGLVTYQSKSVACADI